jgi:hypothetical protein
MRSLGRLELATVVLAVIRGLLMDSTPAPMPCEPITRSTTS